MKTPEKIRTSILLIVILLLISVIIQGNRPLPEQNETNHPEGFKPFMYYDAKTSKIIAKGYDSFTYGPDSSYHIVDVKKGKNSYYFVLYDMSIEFKIIKYDE